MKRGKSVLERLFQPAAGMERLFGVLMASLQRGGPGWGLVSIVWALYRHYWTWALSGIILASIPFVLSLWLIRPILTTAAGVEWLGLGAIFLSALIFILAFGLLGADSTSRKAWLTTVTASVPEPGVPIAPTSKNRRRIPKA